MIAAAGRRGRRSTTELPSSASGRRPASSCPAQSSAGRYAAKAKSQWSASSFANLPIGQGVSMTLLQLAGMYQTIANGGVRVPPTHRRVDQPRTARPRASPAAGRPGDVGQDRAHPAVDMLGRCTTCRATTRTTGPRRRRRSPATGWPARPAPPSRSTRRRGDYSETLVNSTFAGIVPADNPQFVIALHARRAGRRAEGGAGAAPLFHRSPQYAMDGRSTCRRPPAAAERTPLYVNWAGSVAGRAPRSASPSGGRDRSSAAPAWARSGRHRRRAGADLARLIGAAASAAASPG